MDFYKLFDTEEIEGNFCKLIQISKSDFKLIHELRNSRSEFIEPTGDIESQKLYLKNYFKSFKKYEQIYFKVFDPIKSKFCGVFRLTEIKNKVNFNWESAVFNNEGSPYCFIDTMLMTYRIGFDYLNREFCGPWKVKKNNIRMMALHDKMKMVKIINEDDIYFSVKVEKKDYFSKIEKYKKLGFAHLGNLAE